MANIFQFASTLNTGVRSIADFSRPKVPSAEPTRPTDVKIALALVGGINWALRFRRQSKVNDLFGFRFIASLEESIYRGVLIFDGDICSSS
jgi:hypothetical protein